MDLEWSPPTQDVLNAVSSLRSGDGGYAPMQLDLPWELEGGSPPAGGLVVVVDTNILIGHLPLLRDFVHLASSHLESHRPTLLIPHIVVAELDGLKNSSRVAEPTRAASGARAQSSIAVLARAATNWLLDVLEPGNSSAVVRGQRKGETLFGRGGPPRGENNDSLVLDAALFHAESGRAVLLSDDRNLRLRATIEEVEALGVDDGVDARRLLERLVPATAGSPAATNGNHAPARPALSPEHSRHSSTPKTPRRRPSSPPRRAPSPPAPPLVPTPSRPSRITRTTSMELDPPTPPPLHASLGAPPLWPIQHPPDVFRNASTLVAHFVALQLYRHVFEHLRRTRAAEQGRWQVELGDWREWQARECVEAARRWWDEGDVVGLCRLGLEAAAVGRTAAVTRSPLQRAAPKDAARPPSPTSARGASSSRWASPASSRAPLAPTPVSPPPPSPSLAPSTSYRPRPSVEHQLRELNSSLPILSSTLSVPPDSTRTWSTPRWEVLLEGVAALLLALLGGAVKGDVRDEVQRIVGEWVEDLARLGIRVEVEV
ncbi:uncharacterized protein RHOBADRAFT_50776 [Rhodotorula graminis WP1]|uniref:PIN domain-containing protein n=1 Tax=Rhodotorula graminis (strain WP1) TaxID=578459 RepID=A0A194SCX5_RHOGW|nr:uncharacterized protein RHOBADRAFT_50776 [Rhodotorula graminis WP1]KPV78295.1 hypothetical protein RHOBADRAFT_50776 [Rhodotorula graminis WP1]